MRKGRPGYIVKAKRLLFVEGVPANREAARPRQNQSDRIGHDKSAYLGRGNVSVGGRANINHQSSLLPINRSVSSEHRRLGVPLYFHTKHRWLTRSRNA